MRQSGQWPPAGPAVSSPGRHLIFVETDAAVAAAQSDPASANATYVALGPMAAWALAAQSILYLKLEDGYAEPELRAISEPILESQEAWADWVDGELARRIPQFAGEGFRPARLYLYFLKLMFDNLTIRAYTLNAAFGRWQPGRVQYVGAPSGHERFSEDLLFRDSLYSAMIERAAAVRGIPFGETTMAGTAAAPAPAASIAVTARRALSGTARRLTRWWRRAIAAVSGPADAGALVLSDHYDVGPLKSLAGSRGLPVVDWEHTVARFRAAGASKDAADVSPALANAWADLARMDRFRAPASAGGFDAWDLAAPRLQFWLTTLVARHWCVYRAVRAAFAPRPPAAVVVPYASDGIERSVLLALRSIGARAYIYQHGGFVGVCENPAWDVSDLWLADYLLTHGDGVTEYFDGRRALRSRPLARAISVGSSRLDAKRWRDDAPKQARDLIVLVPNVIGANRRYLDKGKLPDLTEAELQATLVAMAREFPQYEFVYKTFPGAPNENWTTPAIRLGQQPGSNCRVEFRTPLRDLMVRASLIVLLMPSTALLEAVLTDAEVLLFADARSIELLPQARAALAPRAHVEQDAAGFVATYRRLLEKGFTSIGARDTTFAARYATHHPAGQAAARALDAVLAPS